MNIPKAESKGIHYKNIVGYLKGTGTNDVELNLLMIIESASLFNNFLEKFRGTNTLIHKMSDNLRHLILLIATKICEQVELDFDMQTIFRTENLIHTSKIVLSSAIQNRIDKLKR